MRSNSAFRRINHRGTREAVDASPDSKGLHELLTRHVVEPFGRLSELRDAVVGIGSFGADESPDAPWSAAHPTCAAHAGSTCCRRSWLRHRAELARGWEAHWHVCDYGLRCALVPVVQRDTPLAAVRLTCPADQSEQAFVHHVELLDILVENFMISHVAFLDCLMRGRAVSPEALAGAPSSDPPDAPRPYQPRVAQAIKYVDDHLCDPDLNVGRVARALHLNPNYLGGLFVERLGQRLSRFILDRRIERARRLLATTDDMIKEIAGSVGFVHPNWFCHVFAACTGQTPVEYRNRTRRAGRAV